MKNKGQSLIEIIFSIGVVVLVLTGVVALLITTSKVKRTSMERQKAIELSQTLIENQILTIKNDPAAFWGNAASLNDMQSSSITNPNYPNYTYNIFYKNCDDQRCTIRFDIKWGESQSLSVERLFLKQGV